MATLFVFDWSLKWILVISGLLLLAFWLAWLSRTPEKRVTYPYEQVLALLTVGELDFFHALREAVQHEFFIACKPRLADVITVEEGAAEWRAAFNRIQSKHVDFLLCRPDSLAPVLVIELDDPSHNRPDRIERDEFVNCALAAANLPILHVPIAESCDPDQLQTKIREALQAGTT